MQRIVISIDAMGGANAPYAVVEALANAVEQNHDIDFLIFGEELRVPPLLKLHNINTARYKFIPTKTVVSDHDKPLYALKNGQNSSMRQAIDAVKDGRANVCISCGNTGALMLMAKMSLGALPGIKRPAISGIFPTTKGKTVMLDMGANNECSDFVLFQFALMGSCLAKALFNINNPSIGILNVGEEEGKGRELERKTYELLQNSGLNFIGYVEGNQIVKGKADVIVTDGFSGNLVLKASEGVFSLIIKLFKEACTDNGFISKIGALLLRKSLKAKLQRFDPDINNGAMFIGINGIVIKSHGASSSVGILNAIETAYGLAERNINEEIIKEMKQLEDKGIGLGLVERIKNTLGIGS